MAHDRTKQTASADITRAGTQFFRHNEFGSAARKEFDGNRRLNDGVAVEKAFELEPVLATNALPGSTGLRLLDACRLVGLAEGLNALACLLCNGIERRQIGAGGRSFVGGSWSDEDAETHEATTAKLRGAMDEILAKYGARVVKVLGDPRGHVVHIEFPNGANNRGLSGEKVWGL